MYHGAYHGMSIAVKRLNLDITGPLVAAKQFRREASVLACARHENIVQLYGTCPEAHALVFQYVDGGNLANRLSQQSDRPLPWLERLRIAKEVAAGLDHLHGCGVVHM
jgi:serine/threonine protein kinase